jgi:large subunit ribosomal protein L29
VSAAKELRDRGDDELRRLEDELKKDLFKLSFQHRTQQLENTAKLKATRKQIARVKTILREREST